ncbi:MAG: hypothetical protein WAT91_06230, partial [Saprospiraceae bacterium]
MADSPVEPPLPIALVVSGHSHLDNVMSKLNLKYRIWNFEVDILSTVKTYENLSGGGADTCECYDCKNYVAYRENVYPDEVLQLFNKLGIDYRKDVEVDAYCRNNKNE